MNNPIDVHYEFVQFKMIHGKCNVLFIFVRETYNRIMILYKFNYQHCPLNAQTKSKNLKQLHMFIT